MTQTISLGRTSNDLFVPSWVYRNRPSMWFVNQVMYCCTVCRQSHWWNCRLRLMQWPAIVFWLVTYFHSKHSLYQVDTSVLTTPRKCFVLSSVTWFVFYSNYDAVEWLKWWAGYLEELRSIAARCKRVTGVIGKAYTFSAPETVKPYRWACLSSQTKGWEITFPHADLLWSI